MVATTGYTIPVRVDPTAAVAGAAVATSALAGVGGAAKNIAGAVQIAAAALGGLSGAVAVGFAATQIALFEEAMAKVQAVTGATEKQFLGLSKIIRRLGATTVFTAKQAAEAALFLSRAGFTASETSRSLSSVLALARAGGIELEKAGNITANVLRGFGLAAGQAGRVANALAIASSRANTTIQELGEGIKFVAPVATAFGLQFEETVAILAKLSDAGLKASISGTGLRRILSGLANVSGPTQELLDKLGITLEDIDVRARGALAVIQTLSEKGVGGREAFQLFGQRGGPGFLVLKNVVRESSKLNEELLTMRGRALEMARIMDDTLAASFKAFISAVSESILLIGDGDTSGTFSSVIKRMGEESAIVATALREQSVAQGGLRASVRGMLETMTGVLSVWNNMIIEFASGRDLTIAQTKAVEDQAQRWETWLKTIGVVIAVPLGAWLIYLTGVLGGFIKAAVTARVALLGIVNIPLGPIGAIATIILAAYVAITTQIDSNAEKLEKSAERIGSALDRIREAAGDRNYEAGQLGGVFTAQAELLNKFELVRDLPAEIERLGERTAKAIEYANKEIQRVSAAGNKSFSTRFVQYALLPDVVDNLDEQIAEHKRNLRELKSISQQVAAGDVSESISERAATLIYRSSEIAGALTEGLELLKGKSALEASSLGTSAGAEFINSFSSSLLNAIEAGQNVIEIKRLLPAFDVQSTLDVDDPKRLGFFQEKATQFSASVGELTLKRTRAETLDFLNKKAGLIERLRALALLEIDERLPGVFGTVDSGGPDDGSTFLNDRYTSDGTEITEFIKQQRQFNAQQPDGVRAQRNEITDALEEEYKRQADTLLKDREDFIDAYTKLGVFEKKKEVSEKFETFIRDIDEREGANLRLRKTLKLLKDAAATGEIEEGDISQIYDNIEAGLKDRRFPLEALIRGEEEQLELIKLTGEERSKLQAAAEVAESVRRNASLLSNPNEIKAKEQELFLLKEENRLYSERKQIQSQLGVREGAQPSPLQSRAVDAQQSLNSDFGKSQFTDFKNTLQVGLLEITTTAEEAALTIGDIFTNVFETLSTGISDAIAQVIVYGGSIGDILQDLGRQILQTLLSSLIQVGIQLLLNAVLTKAFGVAGVVSTSATAAASVAALGVTTAAGVIAGATLTSAYTPAAVAAAIATYGGANAFGIAAQALIAGSGIAGGAKVGTASTGGAGINPGVGLAAGGYVSGPGGPRADAIPAFLSNGEFVINSEATRRNRALLESINSTGYATGGAVGQDVALREVDGGGSMASNSVTLDVKVVNETIDPIRIEQRREDATGQILLVVKEAFGGGIFDEDLEELGAVRQPD